MNWRHACLPARQCTSTSCSRHSRASAPSSSVLTRDQPTVLNPDLNPVDHRIWSMIQECMCIKCQFTIWTSGGSGLLRHGWISDSRVWWMMRSINGDEDWKRVSTERVNFEYLLWRCLTDIQVATHHNQCLPEPPMPHTTGSFQSHQHLEENYIPSVMWTTFAFHTVVQ